MYVTEILHLTPHPGTFHGIPAAARNSVAVGVLGHFSMRNGNMPQDIPPLENELLEYFANNQQA